MLTQLSIQNIVLIERLDLALPNHLIVMTGETGAGKSIILDALGLAIGERASSGLLRADSKQGSVTASFEVEKNHPAFAALQESGLNIEEDPLVLRRVITNDGKSKAFINDEPVSLNLLKRVGSTLVEVQGQFEQHGLLNTSNHINVLDQFGGLINKRQQLETLYTNWRIAESTLSDLMSQAESAKANEEYLQHAVDELEKLGPQPGEEEILSEKRTLLQNRSKILSCLEETLQALTNDEGVEQNMLRTTRTLNNQIDKLGEEGNEILNLLDNALDSIQQASQKTEDLMHSLLDGEENLEALEDRLFGLRGIARKHQCQIDDLPDLLVKLQNELQNVTDLDNQIASATKSVDAAKKQYHLAAKDLSVERQKSAKNLDKLVKKELAPLKLEKAQFETVIQTTEDQQNWTSSGIDKVQFMCTTNPGQPLAPLSKVASGGELSRFLLALKVILAGDTTAQTLIFDEVDSGIGGAVADAVGERLARLSQSVQVVVITHSPQVAACGKTHLQISKSTKQGKTHTSLQELDKTQRQEEIARMLSGANITEEARAQANRLMVNG